MFSTLRNPKVPFVSIPLRQSEVPAADLVLGKVRCHAFTESAVTASAAPKRSSGMYRVGFLVLKRACLAWLSGRGRKNPLIATGGAPIAPVEVITLDQRKAALPDHLKGRFG